MMLDITNNTVSIEFACPDCNCKFGQATDLLFYGKFMLAHCLCQCCENTYLHTLPSGDTVVAPISYSLKTKKAVYPFGAEELALPLINSLTKPNPIDAVLSKKIITEYIEVILVNCLESKFEKVVLHIVNASKIIAENPSKGLILLIPKSFEWLSPKGIAELWLVDLELPKFNLELSTLDTFIKTEQKRFHSFHLFSSQTDHELEAIKVFDYVKMEPFDVSKFQQLPYKISYILSEETYWITTKFDSFLLAFSKRSKRLKWLNAYFRWNQNRLLQKLTIKIHASIPKPIQFYAFGTSRPGSLPNSICDYRKSHVLPEDHQRWCAYYSQSHLVIGVHGSGMLLPSALAAGFIKLVPPDKIDSIADDVWMKSDRSNGTFLNTPISVELIAKRAVSILSVHPTL